MEFCGLSSHRSPHSPRPLGHGLWWSHGSTATGGSADLAVASLSHWSCGERQCCDSAPTRKCYYFTYGITVLPFCGNIFSWHDCGRFWWHFLCIFKSPKLGYTDILFSSFLISRVSFHMSLQTLAMWRNFSRRLSMSSRKASWTGERGFAPLGTAMPVRSSERYFQGKYT